MAPEKFKRLVHYIIASSDETKLGATKLNKILWFVDSIGYRLNGVSVTGEAYVKRQMGPVPKHILATLKELEGEGAITVRERDHFGHKMRVFIGLKDVASDLFSEQELEIVDEIMDNICNNHTAGSISELSHDQIWEAADMGEEIPLFVSLAATPGEITSEAMVWGSKVVEEAESRVAKASESVANP